VISGAEGSIGVRELVFQGSGLSLLFPIPGWTSGLLLERRSVRREIQGMWVDM
jgi:hypothetical protein